MELAVIDYLRGFADGDRALAQLKEIYGIEAKRHPDYPELYQLNYSQIDSPKTHPIVRDCRGLILNRAENWRVVALPFRRFFNYGEAEAEKEIDWSTAKVQEKVDGSLIVCYYYDGWQIATRSNPKGDSPVNRYNLTFRELFLNALRDYDLREQLNPHYTYLFEVCSPYNRVVVSHSKTYAVGLASFHTKTYQEGETPEFNPVKKWSLTDVDELLDMAKTLNPLNQEGYVVVDEAGNRLKIKSPKYIALHHLISNMSRRKMIELVRQGETEEILTYYPELKEEHDKVANRLESLLKEAEELYETNKNLPDKKSFALQVKDHPLSGLLFNLKDRKISSFQEGIREMSLKKLEQILRF